MICIEESRLRFLVVDDNVHMRRMLRSLLHGFGARMRRKMVPLAWTSSTFIRPISL